MTTNYERIKQMSVEEMSGYISTIYKRAFPNVVNLKEQLKQWLESEAEYEG